jgi:hypothetical protein
MDIVGHFHTPYVGEKNDDEENKKHDELNNLYRGDRENSHNVHMSHKAVFCSLRSDLDRMSLDPNGTSHVAL